jgi:hypothetical protein
MATRLTVKDATELCQLLNELTDRMRLFDSLANNVFLHVRADGDWRVLVGPPPAKGHWFDGAPFHPTPLEALRAAIEDYRSHATGLGLAPHA